VLGAGGVGGLVAAALARAGRDVTLIVRSPGHPRTISVESRVLGDFEVEVKAATTLDHDVDLLWVAVKAPQLEEAITAAPAAHVKGTVIPLLNGIDHLDVLRRAYPSVSAGSISVESERVAPGRIVQPQPFVSAQVAGPLAAEASAELNAAGIACAVKDDALSLLWQKLLVLAPLALTTTARRAPLGEVRADPAWWERLLGVVDEAAAVAAAEGARVDAELPKKVLGAAPESFRSSMQKDREAGRELELDHIAGPIRRGGRKHGIPTPVVDELYLMLEPVAAGS
jgi:2-dehydropantoate 2-reductase